MVIEVGIFSVPVTEELRAMFERTHQAMSGTLPPEQQFSRDEQYEMLLVCQVSDPSTLEGRQQQTDNYLELIHYLADKGVPVPQILPEARCSTDLSSWGDQPRALSTHLHAKNVLKDVKERRLAEVTAQPSTPLFLEPKYEGSKS